MVAMIPPKSSPLSNFRGALKAMNKVRNRIVHADGALDDGLRRIINRTKGLSIKYHNNLIVDRTYIDCSITTVENFLKKLYSEAIYG